MCSVFRPAPAGHHVKLSVPCWAAELQFHGCPAELAGARGCTGAVLGRAVLWDCHPCVSTRAWLCCHGHPCPAAALGTSLQCAARKQALQRVPAEEEMADLHDTVQRSLVAGW